MSADENKALYMRYQAALQGRGKLDEVIAPDFMAHDLPPGLTLAQFRQMANNAFLDQKAEVVDIIAGGDKVAARIIASETNLGKFQGHPPTGKRATFELLEIVRIDNGKIAERWTQFDRGHVMQQLGIVQSPWQAS